MKPRCGSCRFFHDRENECRRYAPRMLYPKKKWLDIHNSELLRDIAWSVRAMAAIGDPKSEYDDLMKEATECSDQCWPRVESDDWCGEFEARGED
jgi:hypothetical protein